MFCPKCGTQNDDNAGFCSSCGNSLNAAGTAPASNSQPVYNTPPTMNYNSMPNVPNYLAWSIVSTLLCCMPFGIVAIIFSSQVDSKLRNGDYEGALKSSKNAKMWCWIAFGSGLAFGFIYLIFVVLAASM